LASPWPKAAVCARADPILQAAWQGGEKSPDVGLYLAYARAVNAHSRRWPITSTRLLTSSGTLTPERADLALEVLRLGGNNPEVPALAERLEQRIGQSARFAARVTDILEAAAEARRAAHAPEQALALYRRVLARDPERACWLWAVLLAERVEGQTPQAWLADYAKRAKSPARQTGVKGLLAERQGRTEEAIAELSRSLEIDPGQHALRQILFATLLGQGHLAEARAQADWFARKVAGGESVLRSYLAEMLTRLGDTPAALAQWEMLHQISPEVSYYTVENALALVRLNRSEEAVRLLAERADQTPDARIFEPSPRSPRCAPIRARSSTGRRAACRRPPRRACCGAGPKRSNSSAPTRRKPLPTRGPS
jgi:tetratricopeptide (TPR) repeat protein